MSEPHVLSIRAGWTDERVALLKRLWTEGRSATRIAKALGGVTRNSVIGKVHRLGLMGRADPSAPGRVSRVLPPKAINPGPKPVVVRDVASRDAATAARVENMAARERPAENVLLMARAFAPLPGREPVPFGSRGCKWPTGGEGASMLQCGCERVGESPYCATHRAAATVPTSKPHELVRSLRRWAA
jgi:GcrA cell cycle regulator